MASFKLLETKAWCDQVTETPEDNSTTVFKRGTPQGERGLTPKGGQLLPISIEGAKLLWKNLQKKAKKKHTSDRINKTTPIRKPLAVFLVWEPCIVLSRTTSRHH